MFEIVVPLTQTTSLRSSELRVSWETSYETAIMDQNKIQLKFTINLRVD